MIRLRHRRRFCCARLRHSDQLPPSEWSRQVSRNESPFEPDWIVFDGRRTPKGQRYHDTRWGVAQRRRKPDCGFQALMEAPPHHDPDERVADGDLKELLGRAVDSLPARERWVFEAHHYRGLSFREIGRELSVSKTTADRIYREALKHLREELS